MFFSNSQPRIRPNMTRVLIASVRFLVFALIFDHLYYGQVISANIIQADDLNQLMIANNDKITLPRFTLSEPRVHPYGSSYETITNKRDREEPEPPQADPMNTAASYYHDLSGGGAKGWLDMGAWTKKKGAFGWYADFPVGGKGK